ncbi:Glycogen debranching protein-like [Hymenobacter roseosalivarius DSM 11622]|uniref:Glycogen debranching protein-like n=1 Tax=Hymenobacter roseosalivarius DSM 11622 TaxID=645990 RepID=A0A1W1W4P2_9BACT|nr:amylo-alpha-1,6-glucosidase [Hymenobacter roseosalivarius]SMC00575.1 Glycogen debranching protein-like [Hymenobacter roseosalivarius DSM 11622]
MQQSTDTGDSSGAVWKSEAYAVYRDSVVQGKHVARVLSPTSLTSNYQSPANAFQSPEINFKFSINGKDNELAPGQDHRFIAVPRAGASAAELPVIVFGQRYVDPGAVPANKYLPPNTPMKIRLDMRPVLAAFKKQGYYTTFKGEKIYKEDFKQVFVAGNTAPLSWDFDNLVNKPELELKDPDGNGIYEVTLTLNAPQAAKTTAGKWEKSINTDDLPRYTSAYPIADALYNLALEEARRAVEPDSTFRTGKEWAGVWTRDISYSIILSMAMLQPDVAMKSLLRKVSKDGRIIQDTGTGGAYPCSTDRMIWATAAWEIYKVAGDEQWLRTVYPIIKKSIEDDVQNAYNPQTGMVRGESSFLDWREQTYPKWMQPVDIYESEALGTNVVHYHANVVLSQMAEILGEPAVASKHQQLAQQIKQGINKHLWQADKGYYGQFLYGRTYKILSPRAEALGEALSVLYGVAEGERAQQVVQKTPTTAYGISCIYPQIPGIPPYHNNAVWPFVQSYWALAAAKVGNDASLTESISAIYRPAALFLTNKENFVAENGDFAGTQINSSNMLWSLSGSLSLVYKVLFGMDFQADKLVFRPFVPKAFAGPRKLSNFKYRGAVLDLEMEGYGNEITTITLDDKPLANATIPATLTGRHKVRILLAGKAPQTAPVNQVANRFSPATPEVTFASNRLTWTKQEGVRSYRVLKNGQAIATTTALESPADATAYAEYQVVAVDAAGLESFASEPLVVNGERFSQLYQLESVAPKATLPYKGFAGQGFVEISKTKNKVLAIPVTVPEAGLYAVDFRYSNGNGPINTENKCAIRTLRNGQQQLGTIVMPQRGVAEWSNWGFSNSVLVRLENGPQTLTLAFEPANENMNGAVNQAMLDYLRLTRVSGE